MEHKIRDMTRDEAYPASDGEVCTVCGECVLGWGVLGRAGASPLAKSECLGSVKAALAVRGYATV